MSRKGFGYLKNCFSVLIALSFYGCAVTPVADLVKSHNIPQGQCRGICCNNRAIEIISRPPGVKIEISNGLSGATPFKMILNGEYSSSAHWFITAYPAKKGQYIQTKMIEFNNLPEKVVFDMSFSPGVE